MIFSIVCAETPMMIEVSILAIRTEMKLNQLSSVGRMIYIVVIVAEG
jgi:hypothetical protein